MIINPNLPAQVPAHHFNANETPRTRLTPAADPLMVSKENLSAANAPIQDVNKAEESTEFAAKYILVRSETAMLAQANSLPQSVLRLLQ